MRSYSFLIILLCLFTNCKGRSPNRRINTNILKLTFSTWDSESGIIIGSDSSKIQNEIKSSNDLISNIKCVVSQDGLNFIGDFIYKYSVDSINKLHIDNRKYLLINHLITENETLIFYIKKKQSDDYLERLIKTLRSSKYKNEYSIIIDRLEMYNKIDKHGH